MNHRTSVNDQEPSFLVSLIEKEKASLQGRLDRTEKLEQEVRDAAKKFEDSGSPDDYGAYQKIEVENRSKAEPTVRLLFAISVYNGLLAKYNELLQGKKNKGGRPRSSTTFALANLNLARSAHG